MQQPDAGQPQLTVSRDVRVSFPFAQLLRDINLVVGPFGSGKTEIALNLALGAARAGRRVTLVDLDVVTPALRSRQASAVLEDAGVELIAPAGQLAYADLPSVPGGVHGALAARDRTVIIDVGGDPTGARVLGSLAGAIRAGQHNCWAVVSPWRPASANPSAAQRALLAIAARAKLDLTGLIGNLHFAGEADAAAVAHGWGVIAATGDALGLPVAFCAVKAEHAELARAAVSAQDYGGKHVPLLELDLLMRPPWEAGSDSTIWQWRAADARPGGGPLARASRGG